MSISPGTRLGPYDVGGQLGVGGMGEVYRATDTKLKREVAIKVLPESFAADPERLARFQREAEVLASLNHPNIAAIYGLEDSGETHALVLELVDGPTLADRIAHGAIPLDEALPIARQIAEALEAAHEQGIIHRDLKPANIKVTPDGVVKVLDFGLAKAIDDVRSAPSSNGPSEDIANSPTMTMSAAATRAGFILGTAAYMSPEQARGKPVDKRADIWAFGAVLYEMLTGQRAFAGDDLTETLADVMRAEPGWDELPGGLSSPLVAFLKRCLHKDPRQRVHDIADVRLALEGAFDGPATAAPGGGPVSALRAWQRPPVAVAVAVALIVATAGAVWVVSRLGSSRREPSGRFVVSAPPSLSVITSVNGSALAISPDGTRVVYRASSAQRFLYLRGLDRLEGSPLAGTENAVSPVFSPDGEWIAFYDIATLTLLKVAAQGGVPLTLTALDRPLRGLTWVADERIVFANERGLFQVSADGGQPELLLATDAPLGGLYGWPDALPNRAKVLFMYLPGANLNREIRVLDLRTREQKTLIRNGTFPRYVTTGHLLYVADATLWAVAFDSDRLEVSGTPVPMVEGVHLNLIGAADVSVSRSGSLVYVTGGPVAGQERQLVWVDRQGEEQLAASEPRTFDLPRIAPDGTRIAVEVGADEDLQVSVYDVARQTLTRVAPGFSPVWTPDGNTLVFGSLQDGGGIFQRAADGSGEITRFAPARLPFQPLPHSWGSDGETLIFYRSGGPTIGDIFSLRPGDTEPVPVFADPNVFEGHPAMSPDGRWLAYTSNASGELEVYVVPFPNVREGQMKITQGGGREPSWSRDGQELFFRAVETNPAGDAEGAAIWRVPVDPGPPFEAGTPEVLFDGNYEFPQAGRHYDVTGDGRRFLMLKSAGAAMPEEPPQVNIVLRWDRELLDRVRVK